MVWQKSYCESGNLQFETPFTNEKRRYAKKYYLSGDISAEIQYTNDKTNGAVKIYYKEKELISQANAQNRKLTSGKCSSNKAFTSVHLTRLNNEIIKVAMMVITGVIYVKNK